MDTRHYLVDKYHPLPEDYIPYDLDIAPIPFTCPTDSPKHLMCRITFDSLKKMHNDSLKEGLNIYGISGYRSYERQRELYLASIIKNGVAHTLKYIAAPGTSEHQTGLALDVSCPEIDYELIEEFAKTSEGIWLKENAHKYGFIISYPENSYEKTGYAYEPWHLFFPCKNTSYYVY